MRIIAGEFRSRKLSAPKSALSRPTLDRARESLFNILGDRVWEADVLDLFAGSGAYGFEALSRGAVRAVFCDHGFEAVSAIRRNAQALQTGNRALILRMDWQRAIEKTAGLGCRFDIVFLDPPYDRDAAPVLRGLLAGGILAEGALIVLERATRRLPTVVEGVRIVRTKVYGTGSIDLIVQSEDD